MIKSCHVTSFTFVITMSCKEKNTMMKNKKAMAKTKTKTKTKTRKKKKKNKRHIIVNNSIDYNDIVNNKTIIVA
jgi:hypothetical protein